MSTDVQQETKNEQPQDMGPSLWDKIGDFFSAVTEGISNFLTWLFGSSNERQIRRLGLVRTRDPEQPYEVVPGSVVSRINDLEPRMTELNNDDLRALTPQFRERMNNGEALESLLPEAFAACREAARRYKNMRHYDVQLIGGMVLHEGKIAEMVTGEGKTLVATLPAYLNGLVGKGVHIVTVNDYLARRDCEWMLPIYQGLGLTAGAIQVDMRPPERRKAYDCDITYGTNSEFGFDYLRDNMKPARWSDPRFHPDFHQCQKMLNYAIIDEVDNILIDEARTPLIISGSAYGDINRFKVADKIARQLRPCKKEDDPDGHFVIKEKEHSAHLTEAGQREAEKLAGVESFYTAGNMHWPHLIDQALKAHHLYKRDKHYVVMPHPETREMSVIIVDEFTGRLMVGRQWSDGLHQAVEAKEGVQVKEETQTLATITLQNFFKLYKKLAGMTGTAMTEANEFWKIYHLDVVAIPTNRPLRRKENTDVIFRYEREKWKAIVDEIKEVNEEGRPILVGTTDVAKSEKLGDMLKRRGVKFELLNAKPEYAAREAEIVAQAGRIAAVTIATNMAGRGTDIILGGNPEFLAWAKLKNEYATRLDVPPDTWKRTVDEIEAKEKMREEGRKVAEMGGLHIIGTERHEARRIDNQLRGRSGRQGDPGSSRFYVALQDDLMRIYGGERVAAILTWLGMEEGQSIESRRLSKQIQGAQKKVEERNFDIRKNLLEYDEVMDHQRKKVYGYRQEILEGANCKLRVMEMLDIQISSAVDRFLDEGYGAESFAEFAARRLGVEFEGSDFGRANFEEAARIAKDKAVRQAQLLIQESIEENIDEEADSKDWNWNALAGFVNGRWGLKMTDRALKQIGKENLAEKLQEQAAQVIEQVDLSGGEPLLTKDYNRQVICAWAKDKFNLTIQPADLEIKEADAIKAFLSEKVDELYRRKEIEFPVQIGLHQFMAEQRQTGASRYNREGLFTWAKQRFYEAADSFNENDFRMSPRSHLRDLLFDASKRCYPADGQDRIDEKVDAFASEEDRLTEEQARELAAWASSSLRLELTPESLTGKSRDAARQALYNAFDDRYRPEMRTMERTLLLDMLDTAWKDHLYAMDHLRSGIGLVSYAQVDPKTEYKRQGMKAFDGMWDRVQNEVTTYIFRMEEASDSFAQGIWQIGAAIHESAPSAIAGGMQQEAITNSQQSDKKVEPIRNRGVKVGRNDPCPCGSGKKYKNCCMRTTV